MENQTGENLSLLHKYHDSEGNRLINFNLLEERKKYEKWKRAITPKQLSLFDYDEVVF